MPGGRPLKLAGDGKTRYMADTPTSVEAQDPAYRQAAFFYSSGKHLLPLQITA